MFTAVVDLPTPPLPLATAMMFFTPVTSFTPRCTECEATFWLMPTATRPTPGIAPRWPSISLRSAACWLFAG